MFSTSSYQLNSARNTAEYQKIGGSYSHTQCLLGFKQIFEIKSDTLGDTVSKNPHYSSPDIRIQSSYPTGHPFLEKSRTILYHHHHHYHHHHQPCHILTPTLTALSLGSDLCHWSLDFCGKSPLPPSPWQKEGGENMTFMGYHGNRIGISWNYDGSMSVFNYFCGDRMGLE